MARLQISQRTEKLISDYEKLLGWQWFSVCTPCVFCEYKLPACETIWSKADQRKYRKLLDLADQHGTYAAASSYRRG